MISTPVKPLSKAKSLEDFYGRNGCFLRPKAGGAVFTNNDDSGGVGVS